jgi:hypothetical protein
MPSTQVYNAQTCWREWVDLTGYNNYPVTQNYTYSNRHTLLRNIDDIFQSEGGIDDVSQFKRDTGFWYGAMTSPQGINEVRTLQKVFAILYYGGLMVRQGGGWQTWQSQNIPIAASISHSARVLVQLPPLNNHDPNSDIWAWLNAEGSIRERGAATHGIMYVTNETVNNVPKEVKERKAKTGLRDKHYYMNVALGGQGYWNKFSGQKIAANGYHGHLYFCYKAPTAEKVGGLLISTEQSAPADVILQTSNPFKTLPAAKKGVDDQWGGTHGLGGHNKYSATGGNDWTQDHLLGRGPDVYLDGMYVDLSRDYQYNRVVNLWQYFGPDRLGYTGEEPPWDPAGAPPPQPARPGAQVPNLPPGRQGRQELRAARPGDPRGPQPLRRRSAGSGDPGGPQPVRRRSARY